MTHNNIINIWQYHISNALAYSCCQLFAKLKIPQEWITPPLLSEESRNKILNLKCFDRLEKNQVNLANLADMVSRLSSFCLVSAMEVILLSDQKPLILNALEDGCIHV